MKSLSRLGVILIGLVIFSYAKVWGADWKLYGSNEKNLAYYDIQSITRPSKNIVRVWVRRNYTEKGVLEFGKKDPEKQYENLSYSINLWEMNCSERNYNILKMSYFDKKGELIQNLEPPQILPQNGFLSLQAR